MNDCHSLKLWENGRRVCRRISVVKLDPDELNFPSSICGGIVRHAVATDSILSRFWLWGPTSFYFHVLRIRGKYLLSAGV